MALKLSAIHEPMYEVELPPQQEGAEPVKKKFPLWDFIQEISAAEIEARKMDPDADPIIASRNCLRRMLGYDALTTHQAVEIKADAATQSRGLDAVKKLLKAGSVS